MSMRDVHTPKRHSWTQDSSFKLDNMASLKPKTVLNICIDSAFKKKKKKQALCLHVNFDIIRGPNAPKLQH